MAIDTDLAVALEARLTELIDNSKETLVLGLEYKAYQQACGMIEAWKQVRDGIIPGTLNAIQQR